MEIDVRWAADAATKADGTVNGEDGFLLGVLHNVLRRTFAEPNQTVAQL